MSNGNVRTITEGQRFELAAALVKAVPHMASMPCEVAQRWIGDQSSLIGALSAALIPVVANQENIQVSLAPSTTCFDWSKVYKTLGLPDRFKKFVDENPVENMPGFWDVPVVEGLTVNGVVEALKDSEVALWLYVNNLDDNVTTNDRHPKNGSYSVRFKANVEADEDLKGMSAQNLESKGIKGITLLERLLLELGYFLATGKHLDVKNVTLCNGSRSSGGYVPCVDWDADGRKLDVNWYAPDSRSDSIRSRAAVTL